MFGIPESRTESTSGELAELPGDASELPMASDKRARASTGLTPPPSKRVRRSSNDRSSDESSGFVETTIDEDSSDDLLDEKLMNLTDEENKGKIDENTKIDAVEDEIKIKNGSTVDERTSESYVDEKAKDDNGVVNLIKKYNLKSVKITLEDIMKNGLYKLNKSKVKTKKASSEEVYEVEKILDKRTKDGKSMYYIKWKNWASEHNTWEPLDNLIDCPELLEAFETDRTQLLEKFKAVENFHPDNVLLENHMSELRRLKKNIDDIDIDDSNLYKNLRTYFRTSANNSDKNAKLGDRIKNSIVHSMYCSSRRDQLESLQGWEAEINNITKGKPVVTVENNVDLEITPQDFFYIDDYLPGAGVTIPDEPPIGCECENCDAKTKCCFAQYDGGFPYTSGCRVRVPPGTPIYECNKRCTCPPNCKNRVVQRGAQVHLCIFRTSNGRGWGVKTQKLIKKGTFITQYVGEVITNEEAEKRGKEYDAAGRTYLFDLDFNEIGDQCPYTVDAAIYGNISHFVNHSCDPNSAIYGVWIDCLDPNLPKLALFATRDIQRGEEITFDYLCQTSKGFEKKKNKNAEKSDRNEEEDDDDNDENAENIEKKTKCKCGAKTCRQFLF